MKREATIYIDIDRDRIRDLVSLAYDTTCEVAGLSCLSRTKEDLLVELAKLIDNSRISTMVFLDFSSSKMNDFKLRVDVRRREVLGVTARFEVLKNRINSVLRTA